MEHRQPAALPWNFLSAPTDTPECSSFTPRMTQSTGLVFIRNMAGIGTEKRFFFQLFQNLRAGKMAQPGKGFATKPNILSFIPETHREN